MFSDGNDERSRSRTNPISVLVKEARCSIQEEKDGSDDATSCDDSSEVSYSDSEDDPEDVLEDLPTRIQCLIDLDS